MKLKINKMEKMKKVKLIKACAILTTVFPFVLSGCDDKNASNYYLVHNDGKYYICTKSDKYVNNCDYEYNSIIDTKTVGAICSLKNNFDYQTHHFSTDFLSEFQVVSLNEVFNVQTISYKDIKSIANTDKVEELGDEYFKNKKYYFEYQSDYSRFEKLKIYKFNDSIIFGYDVSPKRLSGTNDYVYSINDNDVIKLSDNDVDVYDISEYFNEDNYITYDTVLELSTNKKLEKIMEK